VPSAAAVPVLVTAAADSARTPAIIAPAILRHLPVDDLMVCIEREELIV
jgi:hypothetical protein